MNKLKPFLPLIWMLAGATIMTCVVDYFTANPKLIGYVVKSYCESVEPARRMELREAVAAAAAPHRIEVQCK